MSRLLRYLPVLIIGIGLLGLGSAQKVVKFLVLVEDNAQVRNFKKRLINKSTEIIIRTLLTITQIRKIMFPVFKKH